jgi:hypothetical protein
MAARVYYQGGTQRRYRAAVASCMYEYRVTCILKVGRQSLLLSEDETRLRGLSLTHKFSDGQRRAASGDRKRVQTRRWCRFLHRSREYPCIITFPPRVHLSSTPRGFPLAGGHTGERPHIGVQHKI